MDHYFRYAAVRQRLRVGPLSGYLDAFARQLAEYGYAIDTGQQQLRMVSHLSQWMGRRGLQAHDLSEPVLKCFLADRRRQGHLRNTDPRAWGWFLEHLRPIGVVERTPSSPVDGMQEALERDFERYLLQERGLAAATIGNYSKVARTSLTTHFHEEMVDPQRLRPPDVIRFVPRIARSQPPRSAKFTITGLRAFLRFLYVQGRTATDLKIGRAHV